MHYEPDFLRRKGRPLWPRWGGPGWGRWLCGLSGAFLVLLFCLYLLKPPAAKPSLQLQLTVSGSAYRGCCGTLRCGVCLGKEVKCQTGQELCVVTPQEAAGARTAGLGESRVASRQLNIQKDPASVAVLFVCIAQSCCAAFLFPLKSVSSLPRVPGVSCLATHMDHLF